MLRLKPSHLFCTAALAFFASSPLYAESELQLNIPHYFFDDYPVDDDWGIGIGYGYRFNNPWGIELSYTEIDTEFSRINTDLDVEHWQLNGLYHLNVDSPLKPFLMLGVGQLEGDAGALDDDTLASTLGVGFKYDIAPNWRFRTDARWHYTDDGSNDIYAVTLGISYVLGSSPSRSRPVAAAEVAPSPSTPVDTDSDGDGVTDQADRCPDTPAGAQVDASGCPIDSDDDGVADIDDRCPGTRANLKVDEQGCPVMLTETVSIDLEVHFDTGSSIVKPEYYDEVRRVADFLEQYDNTEVVIEGHSDTRGDANYNRELSQRRAEAVRNTLVNRMGVEADRVRAIGYGEDRPLMQGNTAEAHEANRRVVAEVSTRIQRPVTE